MTTPLTYYQKTLERHHGDLNQIKVKLNVSSSIRLLVFIGLGVGGYFLFSQTKVLLAFLVVGIAGFLFLVKRHQKLKAQRDLIVALIAINQKEIKASKRDYFDFPDGHQFYNPEHFYSQDIDLFGRGSFYQYLNRTALEGGSRVLANTLLDNDIHNIPKKQEAVKELSTLTAWRQRYAAIASLVQTEVSAAEVVHWLTHFKPFTPTRVKLIAYLFSAISVASFVVYGLGWISIYWIFAIFGLGLLISGKFVGKIGALQNQATKVQTTFEQYSLLLQEIEKQEFVSDTLSRKRNKIITPQQASSGILKKFARYLDALDQRSNILIAPFVNGFFLRDLMIASNIESWISSHGASAETWFDTIAFFDGYNSLGNYAFNHPSYQFPEITHSPYILKAKGTAHPLLNPETAILNDITIKKKQFFIITGANMAGKSTFLRTVALNIVMANAGLPLNVQHATYSPIRLITSMRTTDSLTDDESYFFSELKRLKFIVDAIAHEEYFIILDEILKGTNSTDKAEGSRKFVHKMVDGGATGIIATHDLSLCETADALEAVENYYFDAQIIDDELCFDYTFKKGICQNMNASFLLKKMNIVD